MVPPSPTETGLSEVNRHSSARERVLSVDLPQLLVPGGCFSIVPQGHLVYPEFTK
jgi:hypothetical protein